VDIPDSNWNSFPLLHPSVSSAFRTAIKAHLFHSAISRSPIDIALLTGSLCLPFRPGPLPGFFGREPSSLCMDKGGGAMLHRGDKTVVKLSDY